MGESNLPLAFKTLDRRMFDKWLSAQDPDDIVGRSSPLETLDLESLREAFRQDGFVRIESALSTDFIEKLLPITEVLESRGVTKQDQTWREYNFPSGGRIPVWLMEEPPFRDV
ncbi:MAG: hypothetical protein ABEK50_18970, partial [bacterium]